MMTGCDEFDNDPTFKALCEMFDARLVAVNTPTHFMGRWPSCVKVGDGDFVDLPMVELAAVVSKPELERNRARLFVAHVLKLKQDPKQLDHARAIWKGAMKHEHDQFKDWIKTDWKDMA